MRNSKVRFVTLLALLGLMACAGGSNIGPGPVPPPPPTEDTIRITNINLPVGVVEGGTIQCGQSVLITVEYTAKAHADVDGPILAGAQLLSDTGMVMAGSFSGVNGSSRGQVTVAVGVNSCTSPVTTSSFLGLLQKWPANSGPSSVITYASYPMLYVLHWGPKQQG